MDFGRGEVCEVVDVEIAVGAELAGPSPWRLCHVLEQGLRTGKVIAGVVIMA